MCMQKVSGGSAGNIKRIASLMIGMAGVCCRDTKRSIAIPRVHLMRNITEPTKKNKAISLRLIHRKISTIGCFNSICIHPAPISIASIKQWHDPPCFCGLSSENSTPVRGTSFPGNPSDTSGAFLAGTWGGRDVGWWSSSGINVLHCWSWLAGNCRRQWRGRIWQRCRWRGRWRRGRGRGR